jgi:hypothetical protein
VVSRVSRAKQFLPFDSLKGFNEALNEKRVEYEEKKELCDEMLIELNNTFNKIEIGSYVKIKHYRNKRYIESNGVVTKINYIKKKIELNQKENINISDIIYISI